MEGWELEKPETDVLAWVVVTIAVMVTMGTCVSQSCEDANTPVLVESGVR